MTVNYSYPQSFPFQKGKEVEQCKFMKVPDTIKQAARELRKSMTPAETILWEHIRRRKIKDKEFQRQKPIFLYFENNNFPRYAIVDFICLESKLIIEVDGSIHNNKEVIKLDIEKEYLLQKRWYKVLRVTNKQVSENIWNVIKNIEQNL